MKSGSYLITTTDELYMYDAAEEIGCRYVSIASDALSTVWRDFRHFEFQSLNVCLKGRYDAEFFILSK